MFLWADWWRYCLLRIYCLWLVDSLVFDYLLLLVVDDGVYLFVGVNLCVVSSVVLCCVITLDLIGLFRCWWFGLVFVRQWWCLLLELFVASLLRDCCVLGIFVVCLMFYVCLVCGLGCLWFVFLDVLQCWFLGWLRLVVIFVIFTLFICSAWCVVGFMLSYL